MKDLLRDILSGGSDEVVLVDKKLSVTVATDGVLDFTHQSNKEDIIGEKLSTVIPFATYVNELIESDDKYRLPNPVTIEASHGYYKIQNHESGLQVTHIVENTPSTHFVIRTEKVGTGLDDVHTAVYITELAENEVVSSHVKRVLNYDVDFIAEIHNPELVTVISPDSTVVETTPVLGSSGGNILELVHPSDESEFIDLTTRVCNESVVESRCLRLQTDDNQWRVFELTARPATHHPVIDTAIISGRDITDQYFFEQRRQVINRVLRHDLRNEMNVVLGHAKILEENVDASLRSHATQVRKKADSLMSLGEEVREIDKELNRTSRRTRQVNIQRVITELVDTIHQTHDSAVFKLSVEKTFVLGNGLVKTAIRHVIENAIEHNHRSEEDVIVNIECRAVDDGLVEVTVIDNGPGIPKGETGVINTGVETQLDHISGLGLWMVKWIMESVNGEVEFDTESVEGTKVTLQFQQSALSPSDDVDSDDPDPIGSPDTVIDELSGDSTRAELFDDIENETRSDSEIQTTTRE